MAKTDLFLLRTSDGHWSTNQENIKSIERHSPCGAETIYSYWIEYRNGAKVRIATGTVTGWEKKEPEKIPPSPSNLTRTAIILMQSDMTMRDYFAGQALVGIMAGTFVKPQDFTKAAYNIADTMLKRRSAKEDG